MIKVFKNSILFRIIVTQIVFGIIPILFLGTLSLIRVNGLLKNTAIDFQTESVRQGASYINYVMDDVQNLIANLSEIDEINNVIAHDATGTSDDMLTTQAKIGYILSGYTNLKGLVSIDLFSENGTHYHVGETLNSDKIDTTVLNRLLSEARESESFVTWNGIEPNINLDSAYSSVITATKMLHAKDDTGNGSFSEDLLVVSYDPAVFEEAFGTATDQSGYTIVLDRQNRIVFHQDASYIGHTLEDGLSKRINAQKNGHFTQEINNENTLIVFDSTLKGGWTISRFISVADITSCDDTRTIVFLVLLSLCILITAVHGYGMYRQYIQPIQKITDTFRLLQSGDFVNISKLKIVHQDEIGHLGELFNSLIDAHEDITTQKKLERQLNQQNQELQEALKALKNTQAQMLQQEKMAAIGQLAAGVAHEINNPLGFVTSNFTVLNKYIKRLENLLGAIDQMRHTKGYNGTSHQGLEQVWAENSIDATRNDLQEIISDTQEGLKRIAEIVTALKTFSRSSLLEERTPYDLNEGIKTTLLIANNEIKYNSNVNFTPGIIPKINANGGQINQVLLNIIVNAAQAIKQKQQGERGLISIETCVENDDICCYINDNGCGMTEEVINRIFEPFFTTKAVGHGTGLGLSLAYDIIVNKHYGKLEVTSHPGIGTCFKIIVPIHQHSKDEVV